MDRRITTTTEPKEENKLKHIAGLIQKLSYRDMKTLGDLVWDRVAVTKDKKNEAPEGLLEVAEAILNTKPAGASL
ncbi:hypothetical protein EV128_125134 [Rhizobium azibense]|nr:hypothetical protein EV128_125134 [Rhizobium azibense]